MGSQYEGKKKKNYLFTFILILTYEHQSIKII